MTHKTSLTKSASIQPHAHILSLWQIPSSLVTAEFRIDLIERAVAGELIFAYQEGDEWCVFSDGCRTRLLPLGDKGEVQQAMLPRQPGDDLLIERHRAMGALNPRQTLYAHCIAAIALTQAVLARFAGDLGESGLAAALTLAELEGRLINILPQPDPRIVRFPLGPLENAERDLRSRLVEALQLRPDVSVCSDGDW